MPDCRRRFESVRQLEVAAARFVDGRRRNRTASRKNRKVATPAGWESHKPKEVQERPDVIGICPVANQVRFWSEAEVDR
jgi:hypothetical protein